MNRQQYALALKVLAVNPKITVAEMAKISKELKGLK